MFMHILLLYKFTCIYKICVYIIYTHNINLTMQHLLNTRSELAMDQCVLPECFRVL